MDSIVAVWLILFPNKYNYFLMGVGSVSLRWVKLCLLYPGFFAIAFLFVRVTAHGQQTAAYDNPLLAYHLGIELYDKEKYGAAQKTFSEVIADIDDPNSNIRLNAEYYEALCALKLFNKDAEFLLKRFIENHSENPKVETAYFQLGKYKFRKKRYGKAIDWFDKVDVYTLDIQELSEYYFKLGYSCFVKGEMERAKQCFFEIKDAETKYSNPATYYYAHIAYLEKNYETALKGFRNISTISSFRNIVPYYISQILYLQEKHGQLVDYALPLLDSANTKRAPEIARLIGEGYYGTGRYGEAIPYLKRYMEEGHHAMRKDLYQLGFAYYKNGDYEEAIDRFKQVVNTKDALAQHAYYHLADCYLKQGKKKFARYAFRSASRFDEDEAIKENGAYNYAKLSCELGLNPIFALTRYINDYPASDRKNEAYELLVSTYLSTKNYRKALKSLDKIPDKNEKLIEAYQRIAYYRGVELFNDKKIFMAIEHFNKALAHPSDQKTEALCWYWKGEGQYRLKKYREAINSYQKFIFSPGAFGLDIFNSANYNTGYAYFKLKDYPNSITWFRKYVRHIEPEFEKRRFRDKGRKEIFSMASDAHLRLGDGYFITKDYATAIEYYNVAIGMLPDSLKGLGYELSDVDYALFQKGLAHGVLGKPGEKIGIMQELLNKHGKSGYTDDAKYEMAKSYSVLGSGDTAITWYDRVVNEHPISSYVKKSLLNMGLEQYNRNDNEKALGTFKKVIAEYPATPESKEALVSIKNIYVDLGDIDAYSHYVSGLSFANITQSSLDSATYEAAELVYMRGDCITAISDFEKYLNKFSGGIFALNAEFYKAECQNKIGDTVSLSAALKGYAYVLQSPRTSFTEKSLLNTATINYQLKNYTKALAHYYQLEEIAEYNSNIARARIGQMRCSYFLKSYPDAISAAQAVLATAKVSNEVQNEAHYIMAKSGLETDDYNLAMKEFNITQQRTRSEIGAASKYYVAYIHYLRSEHDSSEQRIFDLARMVPSYDYWVAKGFILLADNYLQVDNAFQAKATLQSVIDNNTNEELIGLANSRLEKIKVREALQKKREVEYEELEIKFEDYDIKYDELFDEDEEEDDNSENTE